MAKGGLLAWFDRGNQRATDYQRSQAQEGVEFAPYAKSDSARRIAIVVVVALGLTAAIFGWLAGLVALAVAAPFLWKLEHHFFFGRHDDDPAGKDNSDTCT
jgi:hypothetical protein